MKRILYIIIGAAMLLVACSDGRTAQMLSQIDTLMNDHPDSALAKLDSLKPEKANWPKNLRMRFNLLEAKAQNKADVLFTTDSIAKEFSHYYDNHGTPNERMLAHYLLGCVYRDLGEAPMAVDCYLDAISQADTTARDCDYNTLFRVYGQMADVYYHQLMLSFSIDAYKTAHSFALKANDVRSGIIYLEIISNVYLLQNKRDTAELILESIQQLYLKNGYKQEALQSSLNFMYLGANDWSKVAETKKIIDNYERESKFFDNNHELHSSKRIFYYYKGKYFEGVSNLDSAEYYYRKIYYPNMPFTAQNSMYKGLLSVYTKRYQSDSIAKYAQLYCNVNDSSIAKKDQELTAQMAASYNYNRYQKEALQNETRANRSRIVLLIVLSIAFITGIVVWNIYLRKKKQKEYELENLRKEYANATDEYNKNLHTLEILDNTHKKIIESIQEELNRSVHENESYREKLKEINTEYEENKAELTNENLRLIKAIKKLEQQEGMSHYMENTEKLMETLIMKRLKNLEMIPLSRLSEKDWDSLIIEFMTYIPNLLSDLNSLPKITKQKIRVCLLVALKIQDSCIANWLNLKPTRVSNIKAELNEEFFGDASARSLYNNLRQKYNIISGGKY